MAEVINLNTYKEEKEEERRRVFENRDRILHELEEFAEESKREEQENGFVSKETAAKRADLVMAMLRAAAEVDKILKKEPLINPV